MMNLDPYRNENPPRRETLPGGAVMLTATLPSSTAVTLGVWLRKGSQEESPQLGGISHFLEHMVFKGTRRRTAFELATGFDAIGASVDAFTTKDLVAFTVKVLPEYFATASDLLAEMLLEPAFAPDLTALEQDVVCEEIQEALDTPEDRLHDAFASRIYGSHPRGRPILGTPASVRSFGPDVLRAQHAKLFAAPNLVVSLAGNIDESYRDRVATLFGGGVASAPAPAAADLGAPQSGPEPEPVDDPYRLDLRSPILQTYFEAGNVGVSYGHADRLAIYLLVNLLGGGMSSRIFQSVREREGLAYTVYNYHDMGRDTGLVSCSGSCSPDKLPRTGRGAPPGVSPPAHRRHPRRGVGQQQGAAEVAAHLLARRRLEPDVPRGTQRDLLRALRTGGRAGRRHRQGGPRTAHALRAHLVRSRQGAVRGARAGRGRRGVRRRHR
jgi:predicted Zn-dependent peptidase